MYTKLFHASSLRLSSACLTLVSANFNFISSIFFSYSGVYGDLGSTFFGSVIAVVLVTVLVVVLDAAGFTSWVFEVELLLVFVSVFAVDGAAAVDALEVALVSVFLVGLAGPCAVVLFDAAAVEGPVVDVLSF